MTGTSPLSFHKDLLKSTYFQRKYEEKYSFPLIIATFLLYLQRKV